MTELMEHRQKVLTEEADFYVMQRNWLAEKYPSLGPNDIAVILLTDAIERLITTVDERGCSL